MQFGKAIGVACSTFAITNIDDMFVLITFFAEATTADAMTPLRIISGQYLGFTVIMMVSMIGFAVALVLPSEPIGFLGLLPLLLGVWKGVELFIPVKEEDEENRRVASMKSILKVAIITIMNGGDNIGTYIPLFSQAKKAEVAVYVVTYYIMLGIWCLIAYLLMNQRHFLRLVQRCVYWVLPLLYIGLGIFIVVKSECYPWAFERINAKLASHPGKIMLAIITVFLVLSCTGILIWLQFRMASAQSSATCNALTPDNTTPSFHSGTESEDPRTARALPTADGNLSLTVTASEAYRSAEYNTPIKATD
ncbi:hypothetical protein B5807_07175 [Epicoccum nigrum]|uniref:Cadmium resistance transporter n=1 Tax=Epicoccum nigrum TaxID=105696 RepID=A0A1Y2LY69_EPING|nr:hypothetical protein B5807_07175 [Epicoccum nigrum]